MFGPEEVARDGLKFRRLRRRLVRPRDVDRRFIEDRREPIGGGIPRLNEANRRRKRVLITKIIQAGVDNYTARTMSLSKLKEVDRVLRTGIRIEDLPYKFYDMPEKSIRKLASDISTAKVPAIEKIRRKAEERNLQPSEREKRFLINKKDKYRDAFEQDNKKKLLKYERAEQNNNIDQGLASQIVQHKINQLTGVMGPWNKTLRQTETFPYKTHEYHWRNNKSRHSLGDMGNNFLGLYNKPKISGGRQIYRNVLESKDPIFDREKSKNAGRVKSIYIFSFF